ncbi:MAG: GNAT family N-acetyltransferase [Asgard group archaeon]|nr:GNAT family N-acetyltransferase [Asgard group archaeon]
MISKNSDDYLIEQFTIEKEKFEEFSKLITQAFVNDENALKEGATVAFSEDTFNIMYGAPSVDKDLFIRAIHKPTGKMVGFLGSIPRNLSIMGKVYNFAIPSWLCVHSDHQRKGLAKRMGLKLWEIGISSDYHGGFSFHEPDQHGVDVSTSVSREMNLPFQRVVTLNKFVIKAFDVNTVSKVVRLRWYEKLVFKFFQKYKIIDSKQIRAFQEKDIPDIYEIIQEQVERNQLSIVPELDDLKWMLENPHVVCVVHEDKNGKVQGFILAWEFLLAGLGNKIPYGWLDMVHIHRLNVKEATNLSNYLCQKSKEKGWFGLQTPYIPYFDMKPLKKAKFFFFENKVNLDLFNLKNIPIPEEIESFYFDWR